MDRAVDFHRMISVTHFASGIAIRHTSAPAYRHKGRNMFRLETTSINTLRLALRLTQQAPVRRVHDRINLKLGDIALAIVAQSRTSISTSPMLLACCTVTDYNETLSRSAADGLYRGWSAESSGVGCITFVLYEVLRVGMSSSVTGMLELCF